MACSGTSPRTACRFEPVRPGIVEACHERRKGSRRGPSFLWTSSRKERCFDKLSTNGEERDQTSAPCQIANLWQVRLMNNDVSTIARRVRGQADALPDLFGRDRKSTRLNSRH